MGRPAPFQSLADDFFPLPGVDLGYWSSTIGGSNGGGPGLTTAGTVLQARPPEG